MFTYDVTKLATDTVTQLRFAVGDTTSPGFLQDEEVAYLKTLTDDVTQMSIMYCERILNILANDGTYDLGPLKVDTADAIKHYTEVIVKLKAKSGAATPYMADLRPSVFCVGLHSNKG